MARGTPKVIPGPDGKPERLNIAAVALRCGVSTRTVYEWVREGRLAASKVGPKLWWISVADLDAFLGSPQNSAGVLGVSLSDDTGGLDPVAPAPEKPAAAPSGGSVTSSRPAPVSVVPDVVMPGLRPMQMPARNPNKSGKKKR